MRRQRWPLPGGIRGQQDVAGMQDKGFTVPGGKFQSASTA